jgi:hypothetical protein
MDKIKTNSIIAVALNKIKKCYWDFVIETSIEDVKM